MLFFVTQIKYLSYYLAMQSKVKFKKIEDSRKLHTYCTLYEHFLCTYSRIRTIKEYLVHWNNQFQVRQYSIGTSVIAILYSVYCIVMGKSPVGKGCSSISLFNGKEIQLVWYWRSSVSKGTYCTVAQQRWDEAQERWDVLHSSIAIGQSSREMGHRPHSFRAMRRSSIAIRCSSRAIGSRSAAMRRSSKGMGRC